MEKKLSLWIGIIVFVFAEIVYLLTLEPFNSYWDCSEFIACAFKLEVGHAPGAPVFMLLGRFASLFVGQDVSKVALMINALSATASALTILFLFYILLWFVKKLVLTIPLELSEKPKSILIYGAAFIGAITYAFTDSFWFSAVEGEVYATSSLFSAIVFWCILKWEDSGDTHWKQNRWIYLIFFLLGLSVGIHLLNMLALPAISLIFYAKNFKPTKKGILTSQLISVFILLVFIFVLIPGVAKYAAYTDLLFVNKLKLPVYSGAILSLVVLVIVLRYAYRYFMRKKYKVASVAIIAFSFWLVGYSSFAVLVIRSNANPFIDINNVENLFGLVDYLNREQYPSRPLFKGNSFNSPIIDVQKRYTYKLVDGKYYKDELNPKYIFDKNTLSLFPRMASLDPGHDEFYKHWVDIHGKKVKVKNSSGQVETIIVPTFVDNIKFFFRYQIGHMYLRYFMWNFSGRQNDIQGHGGKLNGNWISGIPFLDSFRLGNQDILPDKYKWHESRNRYYLLPLLLGLIGMVYQYRKDNLNFWVVFLLFIYTGLAIVFYLNEIPITPRERDYVYVGSFFAFCIWIGIGVIAIAQFLRRFLNKSFIATFLVAFLFLLVPLNILFENWGDHNRSNRSIAHDLAANTLSIMAPNSIFFTNGDNDTYPIWYLQEVENYRTDVRHILGTFLPIGWYANQLQQNQPEKGVVPISFKGTELLMSKNNYFPIIEKLDSTIDLNEAIAFITNSDKRTKVQLNNGSFNDYLPSRNLSLKLNWQNFNTTCSYTEEADSVLISDIKFTIKKKYLTREDVLLLDIIAQNNWVRPIYFMNPQALNDLGLGDYLHREGNVYRFLPFKKSLPKEVDKRQALMQYNIVMETYKWGNINNDKVFLDHTSLNMIHTFRYNYMFAELAKQLKRAEMDEKALEVLNLSLLVLPADKVGYTAYSPSILETYYLLNKKDIGDKLAVAIFESNSELLEYYKLRLKRKVSFNSNRDLDLAMYIVREVLNIASHYSPELAQQYAQKIQNYYSSLYTMM